MPENTLFYGDNLDVLRRHGGDATVDLVYLDPGAVLVAYQDPGGEIATMPAAEYDAAIAEGPDVSLCQDDRGVYEC